MEKRKRTASEERKIAESDLSKDKTQTINEIRGVLSQSNASESDSSANSCSRNVVFTADEPKKEYIPEHSYSIKCEEDTYRQKKQ